MSSFDMQDVIERGRKAIQEKNQALVDERAAKLEATRRRSAAVAQAFIEAHAINAEQFRALHPNYDSESQIGGASGSTFNALINLRWRSSVVPVNCLGFDADGASPRFQWLRAYAAEDLPTSLGLFLLDADETAEKVRAAALARIKDDSLTVGNRWRVTTDEVHNDPQLFNARVQMLLDTQPQPGAERWHIEDWLRCADKMDDARLNERRDEARQLLDWIDRKSKLINDLNNLATGRPTRDKFNAAGVGVVAAGLDNDPQVREAYARVLREVEGAEQAAAKEQAQRDEQARRWFPFRCWEVAYSLLAEDDDGEKQIEVRSMFVAVDRPNSDGYWFTVKGEWVKLRTWHSVTLHDFYNLDETPAGLKQTVKTDNGWVVVPQPHVIRHEQTEVEVDPAGVVIETYHIDASDAEPHVKPRRLSDE